MRGEKILRVGSPEYYLFYFHFVEKIRGEIVSMNKPFLAVSCAQMQGVTVSNSTNNLSLIVFVF